MIRKLIAIFVCFPLLIFFGYKFGSELLDAKNSKDYLEQISQKASVVLPASPSSAPAAPGEPEPVLPETVPISVDFDVLRKESKDIIAWLYCPDTNLNYPIVQAKDNDYYMHRLPNGADSAGGSLFVDYAHSSDFSDGNTVIYGHNMKNGTMFGSLRKFDSQEYYEAHPVMYLLTPDGNYKVNIFACFVGPADGQIYNKVVASQASEDILALAGTKSLIAPQEPPQPGSRMLTLSTCSYEYDGARFIVTGTLSEIP